MQLDEGFFHKAKRPPPNFVLSFAGTPKEEEIPKIEANKILL